MMFNLWFFLFSFFVTTILLISFRTALRDYLPEKISGEPAIPYLGGILLLGAFGVLLWPLPLASKSILSAIVFSCAGWFFRSEIFALLKKEKKVLVSILLMAGIFFSIGPKEVPNGKLFDGPYVDKSWNLGSRVQYLLRDLPCDNILPYLVSEFVLNRLPLALNNPILPNQPITNRGILSSVTAIPALALTKALEGKNELETKVLPTMNYNNIDWPNAFPLYSNNGFSSFLGAYIALYFFIFLFCAELFKSDVLFFILISNFYICSQMIFSWPKLAIGLIGMAMAEGLRLSSSKSDESLLPYPYFILTGILFHPYGYYLGALLGVLLVFNFRNKGTKRILSFLKTGISPWFFLPILTWAIIQIAVRHLPIESNMLSQNNSGSILLEPRLISIKNAFFWSDLHELRKCPWIYLIPSVPSLLWIWKTEQKIQFISILFMGLILSVLPFNFISPAMILGMQVFVPFLIQESTKNLSALSTSAVIGLQSVIATASFYYLYRDARIDLPSLSVACSFYLLFAVFSIRFIHRNNRA